MRGRQDPQVSMLAFVDLESRVSVGHPIRTIKRLADEALRELSPLFDEIYAETGRPSIPPERLLKASLLIALYSVRSERAFCEELEYHLLFRWFLDMSLMEPGFDASTFSKNRGRLLAHKVGREFFDVVVAHAQDRKLLSDEHFTVDGTLIEAAASLKSFRRRDEEPSQDPPDDPGNPTVNFHGEKRSNKTHESTTDPEARLFKKGKGKEAKLCFLGHALMENRHGLAVGGGVSQATGTAEREKALELIDGRRRGRRRITLGADKAYDVTQFVHDLRDRSVTAHIAIDGHLSKTGKQRKTAVDRRTTRHAGYDISQRCRKRIEEVFGWIKSSAGLAKVKLRSR